MKFDYSPFLDDYVSSFDRTKGSFEERNLLLPSIENIRDMMNEFLSLLFPGGEEFSSPGMLKGVLSRHMEAASDLLYQCSKIAWRTKTDRKTASENAKKATSEFLRALPEIRAKLKRDAEAGFRGDPAAKIPDDEERAAEEAIYNTLSDDDKLKRIIKLKESFRDLYDTINTIINAVNNIPKRANNLEKIQKTQIALNKLKEIIVDYITYNFDNRAYIDNYTNYIKFIAALRTVSDVISYINSDK